MLKNNLICEMFHISFIFHILYFISLPVGIQSMKSVFVLTWQPKFSRILKMYERTKNVMWNSYVIRMKSLKSRKPFSSKCPSVSNKGWAVLTKISWSFWAMQQLEQKCFKFDLSVSRTKFEHLKWHIRWHINHITFGKFVTLLVQILKISGKKTDF